jgi:hypothetical protein
MRSELSEGEPFVGTVGLSCHLLDLTTPISTQRRHGPWATDHGSTRLNVVLASRPHRMYAVWCIGLTITTRSDATGQGTHLLRRAVEISTRRGGQVVDWRRVAGSGRRRWRRELGFLLHDLGMAGPVCCAVRRLPSIVLFLYVRHTRVIDLGLLIQFSDWAKANNRASCTLQCVPGKWANFVLLRAFFVPSKPKPDPRVRAVSRAQQADI